MRRIQLGRKMKMIPLVLSLGLLFTGCGGKASSGGQGKEDTQEGYKVNAVNLAEGVKQEKQKETALPDVHGRSLSAGAVRMLSKAMEYGEKDKNCLISPFSLQMAFGMLTTGSTEGSTTEKELMELLMPGEASTPGSMNAEMATLAERMRAADGVDWNVVNSLWLKKDGGVKLKDSYISEVVNYYGAELYSAPFDQGTVDEINAWVKKNTKDRIPKIINDLDPDTALVLVNALAFDGEWNTPVEEHMVKKNAGFTNADKSVSKVNMLQCEEYGYVQIAGGKGFLKPYKGGRYSFLGLLPPEGVTVEKYLQDILSEKTPLSDAIREADYEPRLQVMFPEFKAEYGTEMTEILKALGVEKAFTPEAEFGKMITEDSNRVSVDQVVHKTMIQVDRKGAKAAAATEIAATEACVVEVGETVEIRLDRPFVYAIIDREANIPIFLGVQNTMAQ